MFTDISILGDVYCKLYSTAQFVHFFRGVLSSSSICLYLLYKLSFVVLSPPLLQPDTCILETLCYCTLQLLRHQSASNHTYTPCSWLTRSLRQESTYPTNFIFFTLSNWFCVSCFSMIYFSSSAFSAVFFLSDFLELFSRRWLYVCAPFALEASVRQREPEGWECVIWSGRRIDGGSSSRF